MHPVDVVSFGERLPDIQELETLLHGIGLTVTFIDGGDFLRSLRRPKPAIAMVTLGRRALASIDERTRLLESLGGQVTSLTSA
jgi:hypothetical protein